jgi:hypothetical protein
MSVALNILDIPWLDEESWDSRLIIVFLPLVSENADALFLLLKKVSNVFLDILFLTVFELEY